MLSLDQKLSILAEAAKYDVSCSSSNGKRKNINKGLGNSFNAGICHSFTEDGRCVSLLKILLTNYCIFDCAYCTSRKSSNVERAAFTVKEVVDLTINFYRRNYIEGLFLSSGIFKNSDYTMERLVRIAKELRSVHNFNGYIHLKSIPGASKELIEEAGIYADRLSINLELPSEKSLKRLAPEKNYKDILEPMSFVNHKILQTQDEKSKFKNTPVFASAGQSSQIIIGASEESDHQILTMTDSLYKEKNLKRVYYSGFVPVSNDQRIQEYNTSPLIRENRLYQADWLLRFYHFNIQEIVPANQNLDLDIDPKLAFALNNYHLFPVEINTADMEMLLKVPGIGLKSVDKIIKARRYARLNFDHINQLGVVLHRAKYFIQCAGKMLLSKYYDALTIRRLILKAEITHTNPQLSIFQ